MKLWYLFKYILKFRKLEFDQIHYQRKNKGDHTWLILLYNGDDDSELSHRDWHRNLIIYTRGYMYSLYCCYYIYYTSAQVVIFFGIGFFYWITASPPPPSYCYYIFSSSPVTFFVSHIARSAYYIVRWGRRFLAQFVYIYMYTLRCRNRVSTLPPAGVPRGRFCITYNRLKITYYFKPRSRVYINIILLSSSLLLSLIFLSSSRVIIFSSPIKIYRSLQTGCANPSRHKMSLIVHPADGYFHFLWHTEKEKYIAVTKTCTL